MKLTLIQLNGLENEFFQLASEYIQKNNSGQAPVFLS
jgi:hypothetical protein